MSRAVAMRLVDAGRTAQVFLATAAETGLVPDLFTEVQVPQGVLVRGSEIRWTERLSCAPERGMRQPNLFFGAADPSRPLDVSVPARTTWQGMLYLIVLEEPHLDGVEVDIGDPAGFEQVLGVNFDRADPCNGEPPRSFIDRHWR